MAVVAREGCYLHYTVRGSGPPVLFIQGVGVQGDGWLPQVDELSSDFTCISFDNRGMGRSQPVEAVITVDRLANDAAAILDAERVRSAHVVGHSLGGVIALRMALAHRERVKSLALLCTFSGGKTAAPMTRRLFWLGLRTRLGTRRMRRRAFLKLVMPPGEITDGDEAAERLSRLFGHDIADQPPIAKHQLAALRQADLAPYLSELEGLPTLVMAGAHDPIGPPSAGSALAAPIPGARYIEVPDASHTLPITHADLTNRLLREHVGMT
ncbi:MAG: alpha/beta fold hydrolase [Acidobacteriota bacterium]|nr:alpha/beta fold hydrolase [Acidobacteriota bacterium]